MKIHKIIPHLYIYIYIPVIIISIAVILFARQHFLAALVPINILFFIIALCIILSPLGNLRFDQVLLNKQELIKKFLMLLIFEIVFIIVFVGTQLSVYALTNTQIHVNNVIFLQAVTREHWQNIALYPWTLYALLGAALAWARSHSTIEGVTWGNSLGPLMKKYLSTEFIICIDYLYRTGFIMMLIVTLSIDLFQCTHLVATAFHITLTTGITVSNFIIAIVIFNMIFAQRTYQFLRYLINKNVSFGLTLLLLMIVLILLFVVFNSMASFIVTFFTNKQTQYTAPFPLWLIHLYANHYDVIIFSWVWQLSMAGGMGFCFARAAKGLSLRMLLLMILILPLLIQLFSMNSTHIYWLFNYHIYDKFFQWVLNANILPALALALLIIFLIPTGGLSGFLRLSLAVDAFEKRKVLTNLYRSFIYLITIVMIFLSMGLLSFMLLVSAILAVPYVVISWMSILAFLLDIFAKRKAEITV